MSGDPAYLRGVGSVMSAIFLTVRSRAAAGAALVIIACSNPHQPDVPAAGVSFTESGSLRQFAGMVAGTTQSAITANQFAVARPNDIGEVTVAAYAPDGASAGTLFALHLPREIGVHGCGRMGLPCRGVLADIAREGVMVDTVRTIAVQSGTVTITHVEAGRLKGTFALELHADGEPGNALRLEAGAIDVVDVGDQVTDGALICFLARVGLGQGTCAASTARAAIAP